MTTPFHAVCTAGATLILLSACETGPGDAAPTPPGSVAGADADAPAVAPVAATPATLTDAACPFAPWTAYAWRDLQGREGEDALLRHAEADAWTVVLDHMGIDADGAPNAYGPNNSGLDFTANAGYPNADWWPDVLVPDPANPDEAFVQTSGPHAGFYVTKTALADRALATAEPTNPAAYVDATTVPYFVFPGSLAQMSGTGRLGDLGWAIHLDSGLQSPFVVADIGPSRNPLGEVSIALAEALGGTNVNPRTAAGAPAGRVAYVVFRNSSDAAPAARWPLTAAAMEARASALLAAVGGAGAVIGCFGDE